MDETLVATLRTDFQAFSEWAFAELNPSDSYQDSRSLQVIAHHLNRCAKGEIRRLLILLPPRSLKSHMVSIAFPAFLLGRDPSTKIIAASYGSDLAIKFSNDTRTIMKSDRYRELFPETMISPGKDSQTLFETTAHGTRFATSVDGSLTGWGADFLIVDDALKASDASSESARKKANDWFDNTVLSRLNDPKQGVVIVVMQRLHFDDLAGHLMEQAGWTVLRMPARADIDITYEIGGGESYTFEAGQLLHPERLGQKELDERRMAMGTAAFYAQYMQAPIPPAGNLFKWEWFKTYEQQPEFSELFMSVDVAATVGGGNFSAFTIWGHRDAIWYLVAAYRVQLELPDVRKKLLRFDKYYRPDLVVIDGNGIGRGLIQELRGQGFRHIVSVKSSKGKVVDAEAIVAMVESGRVRIPNTAPWLADFRDEVIAFPNGKYNDQVDSMVQLLANAGRAIVRARPFRRSERKHISSGARYSAKVITVSSESSYYGF